MPKYSAKFNISFLLFFLFIVLSLNPQKIDAEGLDETHQIKKRSDRGLYITSYVARSASRFKKIVKAAKEAGLNTIVIDGKDILSKPLLKLAREKKITHETKVEANPWLSLLTKKLHDEGFIVTIRLVVFKDDSLVLARPDLAIRNGKGDIYRDRARGRWADPYADEVRLYNELIAEIAALSGVDEIQFDYIRFPVERSAHNAIYPFNKEGLRKTEVITSFLEAVHKRVEQYNVSIAADIFGITAWHRDADVSALGQDLKAMSKYIDVLSPMLYPSHFGKGFAGFDNPGNNPYYFVNAGIKQAKKVLSNKKIRIVPWLQGFNLRSPDFGPNYINEQIRAAKNEGVESYLIWNPGNRYKTTFLALKEKATRIPASYQNSAPDNSIMAMLNSYVPMERKVSFKVRSGWIFATGCYEDQEKSIIVGWNYKKPAPSQYAAGDNQSSPKEDNYYYPI